MNSLALGDDTTIVETSPSCMCMRGPCFLARSRRTWCGTSDDLAKLCKFPIRGNFHGPGGNFSTLALLHAFNTHTRVRRRRKLVKTKEYCRAIDHTRERNKLVRDSCTNLLLLICKFIALGSRQPIGKALTFGAKI
jgi:hypothetical protein